MAFFRVILEQMASTDQKGSRALRKAEASQSRAIMVGQRGRGRGNKRGGGLVVVSQASISSSG